MPVNASNKELNWLAPDFNLKSIDDNIYSLNELVGENGTVIAFICNHCPYVINIAKRLSYEANQLKKININTIAIMSNDVSQYPEDSFENMKIFSKKYEFNFPYLYDLTQQTALDYQAVCTPDIFGFNKNKILKYRGRLDSGVMGSDNNNIKRDLFHAMEIISKTDDGPQIQNNSFGCSIKWVTNESNNI
ncbi:thioredoxin family protein [Alphaproteobacteria bacterium]|nr:thioredoxin family protein [Alphaproteobacteria bacterium]